MSEYDEDLVLPMSWNKGGLVQSQVTAGVEAARAGRRRPGLGKGQRPYEVIVEYEYEIDGVRRTSTTIGLGFSGGDGTSTNIDGRGTPLFVFLA